MYFTNLHLQKVRVISDKEYANNGRKKKIALCQLRFPRVLYQSELAEMQAGGCGFEDDLTGPHRVDTLGWGVLNQLSQVSRSLMSQGSMLCAQASVASTTFAALGWITHLNPPVCRAWSKDQFLSLHIVSPPVSFPMFPSFPSCFYPSSSKDGPWPKPLSGHKLTP